MNTHQDNQGNKYSRGVNQPAGTDHKSIFAPAYNVTSEHEGGYANDPTDRGGETYAGIARKWHNTWGGWLIVDRENKKKPLRHNAKIQDEALKGMVKDFYYYNFWLPIAGDNIEEQKTANFIYDFHVNSGSTALKIVQRVAGVHVDGMIGLKSIAAINSTDLNEFIDERIAFINRIVERHPEQIRFLKGWLRRIESFR